MRIKIPQRPFDQVRSFPEKTNPPIAQMTKKTPNPSSCMAMIHMKPPSLKSPRSFRLLFANQTLISLSAHHFFILGITEAISTPKTRSPAVPRCLIPIPVAPNLSSSMVTRLAHIKPLQFHSLTFMKTLEILFYQTNLAGFEFKHNEHEFNKMKKKKKEEKISRVMHEYGEGKLHSGSKKGPIVNSQKQAEAIALSEARKKGARIPKP